MNGGANVGIGIKIIQAVYNIHHPIVTWDIGGSECLHIGPDQIDQYRDRIGGNDEPREKAEGDFVERQLWFPMCDKNIDIFCNKKARAVAKPPGLADSTKITASKQGGRKDARNASVPNFYERTKPQTPGLGPQAQRGKGGHLRWANVPEQ